MTASLFTPPTPKSSNNESNGAHVSSSAKLQNSSMLISTNNIATNITPKRQKSSHTADLNYKVICPECQNPTPNLEEDFAAGDVICRDCGSVLLDRLIDTRSEWRTFSNDGGSHDDPSRVGGPTDMLIAEIEGEVTVESTMISSKDGGTGLSRDLNRIQQRASSRAGERSLLNAFKSITVMCERIGLSKLISDRAKALFKRVDDEKLLKGKSTDGIIAACIYIACRQEKVPRTFREISTLTLVPKRDVGRCYKAIVSGLYPQNQELDTGPSLPSLSLPSLESNTPFSVSQERKIDPNIGTVSTQDFMARFCSYLNLNMEVQKAAIALCIKAQHLQCIAGKSPISIAAACIYMITQLYPQYRKAQKDIAYVSGVSETTVKNTYKELYPYRYEIISTDSVPKALIDLLPTS